MAIKLAFYQLDGNDGGQPASARDWHTAANDSVADRPGIPAAVITWPTPSPDRNAVSEESGAARATPLQRPSALPAALFEAAVMAILFAGTVATIVVAAGAGLEHAQSAEPAKPVARSVVTVETRILSLEPVTTPAVAAESFGGMTDWLVPSRTPARVNPGLPRNLLLL